MSLSQVLEDVRQRRRKASLQTCIFVMRRVARYSQSLKTEEEVVGLLGMWAGKKGAHCCGIEMNVCSGHVNAIKWQYCSCYGRMGRPTVDSMGFKICGKSNGSRLFAKTRTLGVDK